jgi:D-glycero-alpha-D-manno-heptose 1-phosphate guanylyltransferase
MQAVILAGGLGTRLRSVSADMPKVLVKVGDTCFLEHLLRMLSRRGINDFLFLLGYKSELVRMFLDRQNGAGRTIEYSVEKSILGTAGALRLAEDKLANEFLLINGDSYLDIDYSDLIQEFHVKNCSIMMVIYGNSIPTEVPNNVGVDNRGCVVCYSRVNDGDKNLAYVDAGVIVAKKSILDFIPSAGRCSLDEDVYPKLIKNGHICSYVTKQRFYDVGTPSRLREFELRMARQDEDTSKQIKF